MGNTGKSVARSYSRVLDCLIARKIPENKDDRTPGHEVYDKAIEYLTKTTGSSWASQTPVDTYIKKQADWAQAQSEWDDAKHKARSKHSFSRTFGSQGELTKSTTVQAKEKYSSDNVKQLQMYNECTYLFHSSRFATWRHRCIGGFLT